MSAQLNTAAQRLLLIAPPLMHKDPAFDRAMMLAKARGAALHIVAFDYLEGLATAGLVNEQALQMLRTDYVEHHRRWLETQAQSMRQFGVAVTVEAQWVKDPLPEILQHVREMPASMLIKAVEPSTFIERALLSPLDLLLARQCSIPMHFVTGVDHPLPRRIMAAVDPFNAASEQLELNEQIIYEALKLGMQCKADVYLVYAYDLTSVAAAERGFACNTAWSVSTLTQEFYDAQAEAFRALAERNGIPAENCHMVMGHAASALGQFAEQQQIDIIVMGRLQHQGLKKWLGSTAEHLLYRMQSSILLLPHDLD